MPAIAHQPHSHRCLQPTKKAEHIVMNRLVMVGAAVAFARAAPPSSGDDRPCGFSNVGRLQMNWQEIQAKWSEYREQIRLRWSMLTDDDLVVVAGGRALLASKIRERTGRDAELVESEIASFERACLCATPAVDTP